MASDQFKFKAIKLSYVCLIKNLVLDTRTSSKSYYSVETFPINRPMLGCIIIFLLVCVYYVNLIKLILPLKHRGAYSNHTEPGSRPYQDGIELTVSDA